MKDYQPTLGNWRLPPYNREAFSKVREIMPSASINWNKGLAVLENTSKKRNLNVKLKENEEMGLNEFLNKTTVDAFHVSHRGKILSLIHI